MKSYAQADKWGPFKQLLALAIFGIVLFPQVERFVDETAIGIFLAFINKESPINPVPAVLADTYYSFTHHRVLGKKKIICSLHVLYAWFLNHVVTHKKEVIDLVDYAMSCEVEVRSTQEWIHTLGSLNALKVRWFTHSCWKSRPSVVFQCESFQNVPLMGTQGCINYNPSLTIRQLGYPMKTMPIEGMLTPIFLYKEDPKNKGLLQKISKAWENVVRKDKDEITKKVGNVTFYQWLQERIQKAHLPYRDAVPVEKGIPEPNDPTLEELSEVKTALSKVEEEKRILQAKLGKVLSDKRKLEDENERQAVALEEGNKRLKKEEESKQEMKKYLKGAKEELRKCNSKVGEAIARANEWKGLFEKSSLSEKAAKRSLAEFRRESRSVAAEFENQVRCIRQDRNSIENALREYQQALRLEQENSDELRRNLRHIGEAYRQVKVESQYWERRFVELIGRIEEQEVIIELRTEVQQWRNRFSRLAWLANQAVRDVPRMLRKAEAEMHPFNTPVPVCEFVEFCKALTEELMEKARGAAAASKKKEREEKLKAICF